MPQKLCSRCNKELTPTERALGEIQCTGCFGKWLQESVPAAEPIIRRILDDISHEKQGAHRQLD